MATCPFFREEISTRAREVRQPYMGATPLLVSTTPWCAHKHSPRGKPTGVQLLGGAARLECAGDMAHCQVPEAVRRDVV